MTVWLRRLPLTAAGGVVAALGIAAYVAGWQLGWIELTVVAGGALVAIALGAPFIVGPLRLEVVRTLAPERVMAGKKAQAILQVRNASESRISRRRLEDRLPGQRVVIEVPALPAGERRQYSYKLPYEQRGVVPVGPAVIARQDPLRLFRRAVPQEKADTLWVHPKYLPLPALPVGFAKDLEGPTSDTSPAGDVAFHALREYEIGDDFRHIHWLSTARVGSPMVRHYVDNRRPHTTVVLDTRRSAMEPDQFEIAVQIAASLAVSAMAASQPFSVWNSDGPMAGKTKPGTRNDVLDRLAAVQQDGQHKLKETSLQALRTETGTSVVVAVSGAIDAEEMTLLAHEAGRRARTVIARTWPPGPTFPQSVPRAKTIDAQSLEEFVAGWRRFAR
ncbi:MAG: hypothetical protein DHS20C19_11950 [Acidimicrobiales bacterium]|nr:MAG: hypothetical protein DHS20C19_11950 [Acidimicrobiales bacterium]